MTACQEAFLVMVKRQAEGVMFHVDMFNYYEFLHLKSMRKLHEHKVEDESECLLDLNKCYIKYYGEIPFFRVDLAQVIPREWEGKNSNEITKGALKALSRDGLKMYLTWEEETLAIFKECAQIFKDGMDFGALKEAKKCIMCVEEEIGKVTDIIIEAQSFDYDPEFLKYYSDCYKKD